MMRLRRGFILPVVLVVVGLMAVTIAGFLFFVRAELAGARADRDSRQARLAAESGLQETIAVLRKSAADPSTWWNNPERFRHALVFSEFFDRESDPVRKDGSRTEVLKSSKPQAAWRFSIVARNIDGVVSTMRYGLTPEAAKLNLNVATEGEIRRLFEEALIEMRIDNFDELIDGALDWLDADDEPRPNGAEIEYYQTLTPPYKPKNARLDSIEELLLVKGWSAALLYGEDTNRNGMLERNEDDIDATFPYYDNGDGILQSGLAPFITIYSREPVADPNAGGGPRIPQGPELPGGPAREDEAGDEKQGDRQQSADADGPPENMDDSGAEGEQGEDPSAGAPGGGSGSNAVAPPPRNPLNQRAGPFGGQGYAPTFLEGRINVNAAPARVLRALEGITPEQADAIVSLRREQPAEALKNPQWLVSSGALDGGAFAALQTKLTTNALQFHVESVGYADHTRLGRRLEWIVEIRGPVVQVLYHRDLTSLGFAWPVDDDSAVEAVQGEDDVDEQ